MIVLSNPLEVFQNVAVRYADLKLTLAEERNLIKAAQKGDQKAREILLGKDIRFIIKVANECFELAKSRSPNLPFTLGDFVGWGAEGYIKALKRYDEKKGKRLLTYAGFWVRRLIYYYLKEENCLVRIPHKEQEKRRVGGKVVLPWIESLNEPVSQREESSPRLDFLEDDKGETRIFAFADFELWQKVVRKARLTKREKAIFFQRVFMEKELKPLGRRYRLSKERIRQIEDKAKQKIRAACLLLAGEQRGLKKIPQGQTGKVLELTAALGLDRR